MKRRSFFQALAKTAAIIALAPQLAFRVKPLSISAPDPPTGFWHQTSRDTMCVDEAYVSFMRSQFEAKTIKIPA